MKKDKTMHELAKEFPDKTYRELEQYRKCLLFMWNAGMIKNKIMRNLQRVVCELDSRYQNRGGE